MEQLENTFSVIAKDRAGAIASAPVFSDDEIEYELHVKIPAKYTKNYSLVSIISCENYDDITTMHPRRYQYIRRPWIDIQTGALDMQNGLHVYKFQFVNEYTNDIEHIYFAYTIQTNNPPKPYLYMENARREIYSDVN